MATQANLELVQKLYVAYYGRPADPAGQQFWAEEIEAKGLDVAINEFGNSAEFDARFGDLSNEELVNNLYQQLFGRDAEAEGLEFYTDLLESGEKTLAEIALTIADGAQNGDLATLNNKLAVSQGFTDALDTNAELFAYQGNAAADFARDFLNGVNENTDPASVDVDAVLAELVGTGGESPDGLFTLTALPTQTETTLSWNGVDADEALAFLQSISDLTLEDLGVEVSGDQIVNVDSVNLSDSATGDSSTITVTLLDGSVFEATIDTPAALFAEIIDGLEQGEEVSQSGIVLTPTQNNGGTFESGHTTSADDHIVAGRTELLHGAYIDGGAGYNTLEVDMKGFFAQPFQLLNIQEVQVQNLGNVYDVDQTILDDAIQNFPISDIDSGSSSILDLSRARDLEKLVVTEGDFGSSLGSLYVMGIDGAATARLEGNFTESVNLFYGAGLGSSLDLELNNVTMQNGELVLGHNAGAVNLLSEGRINVLDDADFGDYLRELTITGSGELVINSDLNFAFGEAHVDASANTGGLRLNITSGDLSSGNDVPSDLLQEVTVLGSQARDVIAISGTDAGVVLNVDTNSGRDTLILDGVDAGQGSVIAGDDLTIRITGGETRLDLAQLPDGVRFQIAENATLVVTQAQVDQLGIESFGSLHRDGGDLKVLIQEDTDLSATDLTDLVRELDLALELDDGVTLTATREQLDDIAFIDARVNGNDATVVVTDLPADSQTDIDADVNGANSIDVDNVVISIDGLVAEETFEVTNGDATLSVSGESDLSEAADISGIDAVEYAADGAALTLTEDQVSAIDEDDFGVAAGVTDATLNVTDIDGTDSGVALDLAEIADAGINIGTLTIADSSGDDVVTLNAATTLGGADEIVVPEGTTLNLTAEQFLQLDGGVISGAGTVNITGLTQADIDAGLDLSTITAEHGTITLGDNDVTLDLGTVLGDFAIELLGSDTSAASPFDGQTIRFATADQAGREINASGDVSETSVVWLDNGEFDGNVVDTAGYSADIGRLWISQNLVEAAADNNVESLYTQLSSGIIVRLYTDDLLAVSNPINREVEIEAFAQIDGLTFEDADGDAPFEHVQNLSITLGGASDIGDLEIDNILAPDVVNDASFDTLTINSLLANADDHYLLPEDFDTDLNALPSEIANANDRWNVIGDISSGADREELANVVLETGNGIGGDVNEGVALSIQTITFSETEATTALFDVNGANDVVVKSLDTSDADITGLTVDTLGHTGTLTVTGGSPAAAVSNTEELHVDTGAGSTVAFGTATDEADNPYAGVAGPDLSLIEVTGAGEVDLGVIAQVDSEDFTLTGADITTAVLGEANVDGALVAPELSATGSWTFADLALTITEDVVFNAGGELTLDDVDLTIEGAVDLTELALVTVNGTEVTVSEGATLTLTAEQADGLTVTGDGEVVITELEAAPGADLSAIESATTLVLTEDVALTATGRLPTAAVTIEGAFELDTTAASPAFDATSVEVPAGATLVLTDAQADEQVVTGDGAANVVMGTPSAADLSAIEAETTITIGAGTGFTGTFNAAQPVTIASSLEGAPDEVFDITLAQNLPASVVLDGVDLTATAAQLDGLSVTGASSVSVLELDETPAADLSGIEVPLEIDLEGDDTAFTGQIGAVDVSVIGGAELDITAADSAATSYDVAAGSDLVLTGAQADGMTITGSGDVTLTEVESGQDFSAIDTDNLNSLTIQAAAGVETLALSAAQLDGLSAIITGNDLLQVNVTGFEDAPGADLSGLNVATDVDVEIQLDSTGNVEIGADADLSVNVAGTGAISVAISGNGEVSVAQDADLSAVAGFVVGADATLVADQSLTGVSLIDVQDVSGEGTLQVSGLDGATVTLLDPATDADADNVSDGPRFTDLEFAAGDSLATVNNFETGLFTYDSDALIQGVHRLDFTGLFGLGTLDYEDISAELDGSVDNTGLSDILSFSVASPGTFDAAGVEAALADGGVFNTEIGGGASVDFGANAEKIFLVSDGSDAKAFFWQDGDGAANDGVVQAGELTDVVTLDSVNLAGLADLENANFVLA